MKANLEKLDIYPTCLGGGSWYTQVHMEFVGCLRPSIHSHERYAPIDLKYLLKQKMLNVKPPLTKKTHKERVPEGK